MPPSNPYCLEWGASTIDALHCWAFGFDLFGYLYYTFAAMLP